MLKVWMLNVGHGDSIVIQYAGPNGNAFGVIDSNKEGNSPSKALQKLQELHADQLSFVALTHPHKDHYRGLIDILNAYDGSVKEIYTFPMGRNKERLKKLAQMYINAARNSGSETILNDAYDFIKFMKKAHQWIESSSAIWIDAEGPTSQLRPPGFAGVHITTLLPFKRYKGEFFQYIDESKPELLESARENDLSLALCIKYAGCEIILGGDAPIKGWRLHKHELEKAGERQNADVCKLPHHGSKIDCGDDTLQHIFGSFSENKKRIALISANGKTHPCPDVLKQLKSHGVLPYCTNLATVCGAKKITPVFTAPDASPAVLKLINMHQPELRAPQRQPCQGDVCVQIDNNGDIQVQTEHAHPCMFRDGFAAIGLS